MSAFGGKADVIQGVGECPLIAISGHSEGGTLVDDHAKGEVRENRG